MDGVLFARILPWYKSHIRGPHLPFEHLEEELGDMLAMIDILHSMDIVSYTNIERAQTAKIEKLKKWSNIQNLENI